MNDLHHELSKIRDEELRAAAAHRRVVRAAKAGRKSRGTGRVRSLFSRTAYHAPRERPALT